MSVDASWHAVGAATPARRFLFAGCYRPAGFHARGIRGFRSIRLLRRDVGAEVEFVTIMEFDSLASVKTFAGEDYEAAVVPPKARAVLSRFDQRSQHYEVRVGAD